MWMIPQRVFLECPRERAPRSFRLPLTSVLDHDLGRVPGRTSSAGASLLLHAFVRSWF